MKRVHPDSSSALVDLFCVSVLGRVTVEVLDTRNGHRVREREAKHVTVTPIFTITVGIHSVFRFCVGEQEIAFCNLK